MDRKSSSPHGGKLLVFLGLLAALTPLSTDMYLPGLPEMTEELDIPASMAQLTLTMTMIGMAAGQIAGGPLSDRLGRKPPLFFGMVVFAAASAWCWLAEDVWHLLAARLVQGAAGAFGIVIARAIARDVTDGPQLTRYFAVLMMINGLAPILAPVAGGQILAFTDWRGVFLVLAGIGAAAAAAVLGYSETLPAGLRSRSFLASFRNFPALLAQPYFRGHCLVQCFAFGAFFSYIAGSSFLFQNVYGLSPQAYSCIFGGIGVGLLCTGSLPARFSGAVRESVMLKYAVTVPLAGSVLLLGGFLAGAPLWYTVPVLFVTITPLSVMSAASTALALSREGGSVSGSASALLGCASMALGGVCMPLAGLAGDHTAVPMGCLMAAGYALAALAFFRCVAPFHRDEL